MGIFNVHFKGQILLLGINAWIRAHTLIHPKDALSDSCQDSSPALESFAACFRFLHEATPLFTAFFKSKM